MSAGGRLALIAVLVVALAGCAGVADEPTDREPYAVEDGIEPGEADDDPLADFAEIDHENASILDPGELWYTHVSALRELTFEERIAIEYRTSDGELRERIVQQSVVVGPADAYYQEVWVEGSGASNGSVLGGPVAAATWVHGEQVVSNVTHENGSSEVRGGDHGPSIDDAADIDFFAFVGMVDEPLDEPDTVTTGSTYTGTGDPDPYRNATVVLHVEEPGYIEWLELAGERERADGASLEVTIEYEVEFLDASHGFVFPSWVEEVPEDERIAGANQTADDPTVADAPIERGAPEGGVP